MVEHLRERHRRTWVIAAFRGKRYRDPNKEELNEWLHYLANGHSPEETLAAMRQQSSTPPTFAGGIASPLPAEVLDSRLISTPEEPFTVIDWDAVKRVKALIASKAQKR